MSVESERPQRPADGYRVMERLLGSPYFERPPRVDPKLSVECVVRGRDNADTRWVISHDVTNTLNSLLSAEQRMGNVSSFRFLSLDRPR